MTTPTIIPRSEHCISRSMVSANALRAMYRLRDHGFDVRLVGGCVRDLLLGREPKDFDLVTNATPAQIKRLFRNCRLVGRRFRLAHLHYGEEILEVATFRAAACEEEDGEPQGQASNGRPPQVLKNAEGVVLRDNAFGSPAEDAWRRDFTINSLSYSIADFSVVDYVGGMADLRLGVVRTIGDPRERFTEDPVRMVRAVRFAATLGFALEDETRQVLHELAPTIVRAAPARLYEEVLKLFLCGAAEQVCQGLRVSGLYAALFPYHAAWLESSGQNAQTWHLQALRELDRRVLAGEKVAPALFMLLFFGEYLEVLAAGDAPIGSATPAGIDAALARFMEEMLPRLHIQRRVMLQMREILLSQRRFAAMPGKKPQLFVARPNFQLALAYLKFATVVRQQDEAQPKWWLDYAATAVVAAGEAPTERERQRRRPRRRRRKPRPAVGI